MKIDSILILAAGFGSRLKPHTNMKPKSLLPLGTSNILRNLIDQSSQYFAESKIYVNASYLAEKVIDEIVKIPIRTRPHIIWDQKPLGPAVTVTNLCNEKLENILVIHGDNVFTDQTFFDFSNSVKSKEQDVSILLCHQKLKEAARSIVDEQDGVVQTILEFESNFDSAQVMGNSSNFILSNSGALVVRKSSLIGFVPEKDSSISPNLINYIAKRSRLHVEKCSDYRISVDNEIAYFAAVNLYNESTKLFDRTVQH
jgi:NDP-sugar pyrophosphorylase family protein